MRDYHQSDINEDEVGRVRGSLLSWLIEHVRLNRWTTGWGLLSEKGAGGGIIRLDPDVLPVVREKQWRGKITSSSSTSEEHLIEEVTASDGIILGGRVTKTAKAHNGRKGVPEDTIVMVEESDYVDDDGNVQCFFDIPDGLTTNPADLTSTAATARTDDFDIEVQGGENGAEFDAARVYVANNDFSVFHSPVTVDSSGFVTTVDAEIQGQLVGDTVLATIEGHIQIGSYSGGPANSKKIMLGPPLADQNTLLIAPGSGITINGSASAAAEVEFDGSGRALIANAGGDQTITIAATGGAADGHGFESVTDGTTTLNKTDGGTIDFDAASPSAGEVAVEFTVTNNDPTATVTAVVDLSGETYAGTQDLAYNGWITVDANTTASTQTTLDSSDWRGRNIIAQLSYTQATVAATATINWSGTSLANGKFGETLTGEQTIISTGNLRVFMDGDDGGKLKAENVSNVGGDPYQHHLTVTATAAKNTTDVTIT